MNKFLLLTSASVLAMGIGTQAGAMPPVQSTLADLCGEIVDVNTAVSGTVEDIATTNTCDIQLSDDAKLSIKDSDITLADELVIFGNGTIDMSNSWLDLKAVDLDITSGDIIIRESHIDAEDTSGASAQIFDVHVGDGKIDLRDNEFSSATLEGDANIEISATTGDIAAVGNDFDVSDNLDVESTGGNVEFKANTGFGDDVLRVQGVEVTVKGNDINVSSSIFVGADDAVQVKNNDFTPSGEADATSTNGPCDIKNNTPIFGLGGACN